MTRSAEVVICGAGITGIAAAYYLSRSDPKDILLVDERPPLSLTSDRSTECYRNWWPDPAMLGLMNRSIDLMEELSRASGDAFHMNRRGYLYVTADERRIPGIIERSKRIAKLGGGEFRIHGTIEMGDGSAGTSAAFPEFREGADLYLGRELVHQYFPYLTEQAAAALHVRRAGWLSAQQLGMYLLEAARAQGVRFLASRVEGVEVDHRRLQGVRLNTGENIRCRTFVNAAGPFFKEVGEMMGLDLPVHSELHMKAAINEPLGAVPREAPLLIWEDPQSLPWAPQERDALREDEETRWLTEPFPGGAHTRPEGSGDSCTILMLWEYKSKVMQPVWPPAFDPLYPEIVLRGLSAMLPRMAEYFNRMPQPAVDGGYYTRTRENRPLIGSTEIEGGYLIGAVSGYGIMSACAAGELLAAHVTGTPLPGYAADLALARYKDPSYQKLLQDWPYEGQL